MKFPQTIQLDTSDQYIFDNVAQPGEWAVSGAFAFGGEDVNPNVLDGADEIAFATAFINNCGPFIVPLMYHYDRTNHL